MIKLLKRWWLTPAPWHAWYMPQSGIAGGIVIALMIMIITIATD
jgi:hypothetical protein